MLGMGAEKDAVDDTQYTALHWVARKGHLRCARLLVAVGADYTTTNEEGQTALDLATENGRAEIVALLEDPDPVARAHAERVAVKAEWLAEPAKNNKVEELQRLPGEGVSAATTGADGQPVIGSAAKQGTLDILQPLQPASTHLHAKHPVTHTTT